ncbi:MAG: hypothetical protein ABSF08_08170, partial [Candidatus Cybelea sp.]
MRFFDAACPNRSRAKRGVVQGLFALLLALFTAQAAPAQSGPGDTGIFTTTLLNGLRVVVVEDHAAPVVQTSMWYGFGSLQETPGKTGLA